MKNLLLLLILGVAGYYGYLHWFAVEPPPPPPPPPLTKKVKHGIKISVRNLLEEWKHRKIAPHELTVSVAVPEVELAKIRKELFSQGAYTDVALREAVASALRELGVVESEVSQLANELISLRSEWPAASSRQNSGGRNSSPSY
jgi:hypothetical protein